MTKKILLLKLGGLCNLKCSLCHCKQKSYDFNPDIINYIREEKYTGITFSGGEPLLYMPEITKILQEFGTNLTYRIVSNGTLLSDEVVALFNKYNVKFFISYNGEHTNRDTTLPIRWEHFPDLNNKGFSILYTPENSLITTVIDDINKLRKDLRISAQPQLQFWINFPHQTLNAPNVEITRDLSTKYIHILATFIESDFISKKMGSGCVADYAFNMWVRKRNVRGIRCCNENKVSLAINGDFLLCPYDDIVVGNIYDGIDWDKVESYIPERCKGCPLWESCMNTCIANITENECYISKVLHKHFYKLMDKYGYTYEQLEELIKE